MNSIDLKALAQAGYNRIPVQREVLADLDTPLSSYLKLAQGPYSYLFESVQGGEKWGRYSILGLPAQTILTARGDQVDVHHQGVLIESHELADPLDFVEEFKGRYRSPEIPGLPMFTGGLVGYFAYDCVRYVEPKLKSLVNEDTIGTPDILLMVSEEILVFDNLSGKIILINHAEISGDEDQDKKALAEAEARLDALEKRLSDATPATATYVPTSQRPYRN